MEVKIFDPKSFADAPELSSAVLQLLTECGSEFVPPLASREGSTQMQFGEAAKPDRERPIEYFEKLKQQYNILAVEDGEVLAFMSFIHDYQDKEFFSDHKTNNYITTLCTSPRHRGKGLAKMLYDFIENELPQNLKGDYVSTRTWETNHSHIGLLKKRGFATTHTIPDHRKHNNEMLDTIYFGKEN